MIFDEKSPFFAENRQFAPLIKYYAKRLRDPHSEGELWGFLWIVKKITKGEKPPKYWAVCLRNEYIRLSKNEQNFCSLTEDTDPISDIGRSIDERLDFTEILHRLTTAERLALGLRFFYDLPQNKCADLLEISRQAVYKNQCRAIEKIKMNIPLA